MRGALVLLSLLAATVSAGAQPTASPTTETLPAILLLLPGPGTPFARAAEAVRSGFFAAHAAAGAPMAIEARETDETPAAVSAAVEAAAARGVRLVVGPLSRDAVDAVARAGGARLPMLALNTPAGDGPLPSSMLAFSLRIEDEARAIVRALVRGPIAAGLSSEAAPLAILVGSGGLERRAGAAFAAAAREHRRQAETFELTIGPDRLAELSKRLAAQRWTAILLALSAGEAAAVRPWLPPETIAVATSRVHLLDQSSLALTQEMEGIAFVDMPWLIEPDHLAVMAYPRAAVPYSAELERLYALGIDAYRIGAEWLRGSQRFELDGVTGRLRVDPALGGSVERLPSLAVFVDGKAERRDVLR